ncbi:hypothetical protein KDK_46030 [Dictyobacter kobayashii]|uniref:Uncharacterized protein n=1 Tax=Dictyobacter kobayashii TaxID=2014872 RepID=A0A402ANR8_9CHLR|nr:hypothetical protein KDK_46030 [Dictyobacter kobayashii]
MVSIYANGSNCPLRSADAVAVGCGKNQGLASSSLLISSIQRIKSGYARAELIKIFYRSKLINRKIKKNNRDDIIISIPFVLWNTMLKNVSMRLSAMPKEGTR